MDDNPGGQKLILKEEVPSSQTHRVPIGVVDWHKETITEERTITVPVRREELVVKWKYLDRDTAGTESKVETIRFPLREERLDYQVKPFDIQDVRIYKQMVQELQPTGVTLKKEVLAIEKDEGINKEPIDG
ncbi:MAG: YsnF/AvaK domain-containing protein [Syntrophomonadaceae bacterium]